MPQRHKTSLESLKGLHGLSVLYIDFISKSATFFEQVSVSSSVNDFCFQSPCLRVCIAVEEIDEIKSKRIFLLKRPSCPCP